MVPVGSARRSNRHRLVPDCYVLWCAYPEQAFGQAHFRRSVFRRILRLPRVHHFAHQMARGPRACRLQLLDVRLQSIVGALQTRQKELVLYATN